uniref:AIG1-type G domain-containing protein n=1 Tax=Sparus aurata TaxID=8175 RepID=A0A671TZL9_SPAAU
MLTFLSMSCVSGIQSLFKWLRRVWRFFEGLSSKFKSTTGSSNESERDRTRNGSKRSNLRLILLGPAGGGRTSLAQTLLGNSETRTPMGPLMESTESCTVIDGEEVAVIDTPDLLGLSLGSSMRAREALRSLQLTSPGPHAFLLVIRAPASSVGIDHDASRAIRATLQLFGDEAAGHIIPVLTHADHLGRRRTVDQLLDGDAGSLKKALSLCDQRPELVDNRPERPLEEQNSMRSQLIGRAMEMKTQRGHFVHELQRREDHIREELMAEMSSALAGKLGHM